MMKNSIQILALAGVFFASCGKEPSSTSLNIPLVYDSTTFTTDANEALTLRTQFNDLVSEIKKGRVVSHTVSFNKLNELFNAGSPSIQSQTHPYYRALIEGNTGWLNELSKASGQAYTPGAPVGEGGVFGAYLFDENGLELEQMIEKGLFGSFSYYQAQIALTQPTLQNLNKSLALYGAHPSFPNTPTASKTAHPDAHMANYAARRSDINDAQSYYVKIKRAFIKAQAAIKAGNAYNADRDAAIKEIRTLWEKVNAATVINYCHSVISTMSLTEPSDAQKSNALHAYGECVGFLHGWRQLPSGTKQITDSQIDEILTLMLASPDQTPESYKFITEPAQHLPNLLVIISKLQNIYGFTAAEIDSYKNNFVSIQNR